MLLSQPVQNRQQRRRVERAAPRGTSAGRSRWEAEKHNRDSQHGALASNIAGDLQPITRVLIEK